MNIFSKTVILYRYVLTYINSKYSGAVIVAQLVEQSLPKPEVCGSNPVIGKNLFIY